MATDVPNGGTLAWRVSSLETDLREERDARRRAVDKLDEEKADAKDVAGLVQAFTELRKEVRDENQSTRSTLKWFIGIYVVGLIGFAGIAVQIVGH